MELDYPSVQLEKSESNVFQVSPSDFTKIRRKFFFNCSVAYFAKVALVVFLKAFDK